MVRFGNGPRGGRWKWCGSVEVGCGWGKPGSGGSTFSLTPLFVLRPLTHSTASLFVFSGEPSAGNNEFITVTSPSGPHRLRVRRLWHAPHRARANRWIGFEFAVVESCDVLSNGARIFHKPRPQSNLRTTPNNTVTTKAHAHDESVHRDKAAGGRDVRVGVESCEPPNGGSDGHQENEEKVLHVGRMHATARGEEFEAAQPPQHRQVTGGDP